MGNHLGPFSEPSDWPEGSEQTGRAVGGQGELCGVNRLLRLWFWFFLQFFAWSGLFRHKPTQNTWCSSANTSVWCLKSSSKVWGGGGALHGVTPLLGKLETCFFFKPQVFGYGESFGTIFRTLRLTWRLRTDWTGCRRSRRTSRSNYTSETLFLFFSPGFCMVWIVKT